MDVIASLILLLVLVLPPMLLAGKEVMNMLHSDSTSSRAKKQAGINEGHDDHSLPGRTAVYDGMITVEIPVTEPQVVAYEPVLPSGEEPQIEIISLPGQASNA